MTNTKRWLDELPLGSRERELLLVGKAARPADGAADANWKALCAALGTTAAASGTVAISAASSTAAASASTSAKAGASIAAGKVASAALLVAATKSLAVGAAIGFAVMGAATVADRSSDRSAHSAPPSKPTEAPAEHRSLANPPAIPSAAFPEPLIAVPATSASNAASSASRVREPGALSTAAQNPLGAPALASAAPPISPEEKTASLARQARELAELKRLIDSGASGEALRRLDQNFSAGTASVLSEERDALYVQALARAQRRSEARTFARQFLTRYPHSPYFETMRQLLAEE